jgi:hypothetical protein
MESLLKEAPYDLLMRSFPRRKRLMGYRKSHCFPQALMAGLIKPRLEKAS